VRQSVLIRPHAYSVHYLQEGRYIKKFIPQVCVWFMLVNDIACRTENHPASRFNPLACLHMLEIECD